MTPEDIDQLKRLKQLLDDGVLTTEEFEVQKTAILAPSENIELVTSESPRESAQSVIVEPKTTALAKEQKGLILVLIIGAIIAGCLVLIRGGGSSSADGEAKDNSDKINSSTISPISTEAPATEDPVIPGQVWNWYYSTLQCAAETADAVQSIEGNMTNTDAFKKNVLPIFSYQAGVYLKVAGLIEEQEWPTEVRDEMNQMVLFLRQDAFLLSGISRTSPAKYNSAVKTHQTFDSVAKFEKLDQSIADVIGEKFLGGEPGPGKMCRIEAYYDENAPDYSIFPIENVGGDIFLGPLLEQACGMARDLQVPNGDNPEGNLNYINMVADDLWDRILSDETYGLEESKYTELGIKLKASMDTFNQREERYMPLSLIGVFEQCALFGW